MRGKAVVRCLATQALQDLFTRVAICSLAQVPNVLTDFVLKLIKTLEPSNLLLTGEI